jgi:hypothetical protein
MLPEAFVFIQLAHLQCQQRMLRPLAGTVMEGHRIELLGTAAILSGYKGTYAVPMVPLACVLMTPNGRFCGQPAAVSVEVAFSDLATVRRLVTPSCTEL